MWDPDLYQQLVADYTRPFEDMLAQIRRPNLATIVDLGCGPGDLTRQLVERWPSAQVLGVDSSQEMLAKARAQPLPPRLTFLQADIATWTAEHPVDLLISNAALQWVPDQADLWPRLAGMVAPGGFLAVQVPDHFAMDVHRAIDEAADDPRWRDRLAGVGLQPGTVKPLTWYIELLVPLGFEVNAWETTYVRIWNGDNPVLDWMRATALRPLLCQLDPADAERFLKRVGERFQAYYPRRGELTFVPAKRLLVVANKRQRR